ncbi:MAG: xanthine dehydrogenase family protein molybdopterin-binding subunit [Chloroflexi bacterium]|nr:xanthine dehydrogenase family protein molybdopterin-binding subunit [Chloroflexota bacterium]
MASPSLIGRSIPRLDGKQKATGRCRYTGDMPVPGLLHGRILRSSLPHARIVRVDTSRAAKLPGVKAVITGADTAGIPFGFAAGFMDKPCLCTDKVRYIGDDIAAVAAIDEDTAEEAVRLIAVELEELPAVFDPVAAMREGAPKIHDHAENNVGHRVAIDLGEVDEGFRQAYLVREDTFTTPAQAHAPMEPHVAIGQYDPADGFTVWSSTQTPFYAQEDLANCLQVPRSKVRVIKPPVGGGFGGKSDGTDTLEFCAALLALKAGRPVRIVYDRDEEFAVTRRRHPAIMRLKTGVTRDGVILARECHVILDGGAYYFGGAVALFLFHGRLFMPYAAKGVRYVGYRVYTNKAPGGAMRGYMSPQAHFAQDVQIELIAKDLGIDPVEVRRRNAVHAGDVCLNGARVLSSSFAPGLDALQPYLSRAGDGSSTRGTGIGCAAFGSGAAHRVRPGKEAYSAARLIAYQDGHFTLLTGASDIGQGTETVLSQLVANELGVPLEKIRVIAADTALTPLDLGSYSSRVTTMAGNACLMAAGEVARQLKEAAAQKLEANPADLELGQEQVYVKGSPEKGLPLAEAIIAAQLAQAGAPVVGQGTFNTRARVSPTFSFGSQVADLTVDTETGLVDVSSITCTHDCGIAINPMLVEGQLEGSVQMGLGYALTEVIVEDGGVNLNPSFLDYKVATAADMPRVETVFLEEADPVGPHGAKEAGEGTTGPTAPAIVNAIGDAVGVRLQSLPVRPEDLLKAIADRVKGQGSGV